MVSQALLQLAAVQAMPKLTLRPQQVWLFGSGTSFIRMIRVLSEAFYES